MSILERARLLAALLSIGAAPALAQTDYPTRPVHLVVPFSAGGPVDTVARVIGQPLGEIWKQGVIVDNKTGAGGNLAAEQVARAAPDGYTLLVTTPSLAIAPAVYKKLTFKPLEDFAPVAEIGVTPTLMIVSPQLGVSSVAEFIAKAKAEPGKLSFGSPGQGSSLHLAAELFKYLAKIDILHVPYRGGAPALIDIMAGQPQMMFDPLVEALPHVKAGKIKALAVSTKERTPVLPDMPTVAESGVPDYNFSLWYAVFAPAKTPQPIIEKLNHDIRAVLEQPAVKERFGSVSIVITTGPSEDFAKQMRDEVKTWTELASKIGLSLE